MDTPDQVRVGGRWLGHSEAVPHTNPSAIVVITLRVMFGKKHWTVIARTILSMPAKVALSN
jgi:hypothetical protein